MMSEGWWLIRHKKKNELSVCLLDRGDVSICGTSCVFSLDTVEEDWYFERLLNLEELVRR